MRRCILTASSRVEVAGQGVLRPSLPTGVCRAVNERCRCKRRASVPPLPTRCVRCPNSYVPVILQVFAELQKVTSFLLTQHAFSRGYAHFIELLPKFTPQEILD